MKSYPFSLKLTLAILFLSVVFVACAPTRYLEDGQYIVDKVKITSNNKDIKTGKLKNVVQPQPLKKIFGVYAFRARVYSIPNPKKDGKRNVKKGKRLKRINARKDKRFMKDLEALQNRRNGYFILKESLKKQGDSIGYKEAYKNFRTDSILYEQKILLLSELKEDNRKKNVFTVWEFLRRIGQKPGVYDTVLTNFTTRQFKVYLKNQGYFNSNITYEVDTSPGLFKKKRVNITYIINSGKPLKINTVSYNFPDSSAEMKEYFNKFDLKYKPGGVFDVSELESYRTNLSNSFRDNGFYYFSKQLVSYRIDTIGKYENATLYVNFNNKVDKKVYKKWKIKNIYIHSDYNPNIAMQTPDFYKSLLDTSLIFKRDVNRLNQKYHIIKRNEEVVKPKLILNELYLYPDSIFRLKNTKSTYSHLSKFKIYKLTNIQFKETEDSSKNTLDCDILLTPAEKIGVVFDLETTNTSVSIGAAGNAKFSHRNLFHGGEVLDLKFQLALEKQKTKDFTVNFFSFNTQEYLFDMKLTVPRLLIPTRFLNIFKSSSFIEQNNPKTVISNLFSYQNRPEFNKIQIVLNYDYFLKSSNFSSHILTPARISSIRVPDMDSAFQVWVTESRLEESYDDHFIIGSKYSYTFSNQGTKGNNIYLQSNFLWSGNLMYGLSYPLNIDTLGGAYILPLVETPYAQFFKSDIDFRYYIKPNSDQLVIWRIFAGVAVPYGNSKLMPFSEKYFVGGANSIRAWQARSLGPGGFLDESESRFSNQTGDIKLELNFEYRFNIVKFLEGAIFFDAGNIWAINSYDKRTKGIFYIDRFYKQIALGTGFGARFNFSFFVFRTDIGIKVIDPSQLTGNRFILMSRQYDLDNDFTINIAIGYPF